MGVFRVLDIVETRTVGSLDASYNLCSELGSKLIFFDEIVAILVLPNHYLEFCVHFPKRPIFKSGTR
jgi:hypothetical protein